MNILERLKELFKPKPKVYSDAPAANGAYLEDNKAVPVIQKVKTTVYKRIALIVGHTKSAQGAATYLVNGAHLREYEWNNARANEIKEYIDSKYPDKDVKIFFRDGVGRDGVAKLVGKWKADLTLELHFNSIGHDKDAFGSEMLILDGDDLSAEVGFKMIEELSKQFNTKLRGRYTTKKDKKDYRGIKALKKGDRGFENIEYLRVQNVPVKLLIEPFFAGTKTDESKQFIEDPKKYSRILGMFLGQLP